MNKFEKYCKEREELYLKCYLDYEIGIDEITKEIVKIPKTRLGLNYDLVEEIISPFDLISKQNFIGEYMSFYSDKQMKTLYYKILDLKIGGNSPLPKFRLKRLSLNFYSKSDCVKVVYPDKYKLLSRKEIEKETGWIESKKTLFTNKNLYILRNEIGRIKIGISENVNQRVKALSNSSGMKIDILRIINFNGNLEWQLHKHFKNKRYIGEWFNLNDDDIKLLLSDDLENIFIKQLNYNKRRYN